MSETVSDVLLYTQDMMLAVIDERWDDLIKMQSVQNTMLKNLFSTGVVFSEQQKQDLFEVQRLNQEIITEADRHKAGLANELRKMCLGKVKVDAYLAL